MGHNSLQAQGPDLSDLLSPFQAGISTSALSKFPSQGQSDRSALPPSEFMLSHGICMDEAFHCFQVLSRSRIATVHAKFHHVTWLKALWGWDGSV